MTTKKTALIIGASRGLGLGLAHEFAKRGWHVTGTVRSGKKTDLHELANKNKESIDIESLDITDTAQISALKERLQGKSYDLLFVNAGVTNDPTQTIGEVSDEEFSRVMFTNALSALRVVEQLADNVAVKGTIGVMSSGLGSVANNTTGGYEVYRASKAALNTLMRSFATRRGGNRSLLLIAPGWIKTDMGGPDATFSVEETMPQIVDTIVAQEGKQGLQYLDRFGKTVSW